MNVFIFDKKNALRLVETRKAGLILWTNGSRLNNEQGGNEVVWTECPEWNEHMSYLGRKNKVFETEINAILKAP